jgi:predicted nucleotidyltransferase
MYEKLNIDDKCLLVLSLFSKGFNKEYHVREIQRILNIGLGTVQSVLKLLEKRTVLRSRNVGKSKVYSINKTEISRFYFVMAEAYKATAFIAKNALIREVIASITPHIHSIGLVFGSYAKGLEKEDSDLDVFIVGKYDKEKIDEIGRRYGLDINIKNYPIKIFYTEMGKDILITEVLHDHIAFKGIDELMYAVFTHG